MAASVLVASSNESIREVVHDVLVNAGYECLLAATGREALEVHRGWRPSLIVAELNLPDMSGIDLLQALRREDPDAAVIIVCGPLVKLGGEPVGVLEADEARRRALALGAFGLLEKPFGIDALLEMAERAIERRRRSIERRQREAQFPADIRRLAALSELLAVFAAVYRTPAVPRGPDPR